MFPIVLDLARLPVALVGDGPRTARRLGLLDEDGAGAVTVFASAPCDALVRAAGRRLRHHWPRGADLWMQRLLLVGDGVPPAVTQTLVATARAAGSLVNVEDQPRLCDFHSPAVVRRGDLLLAVSTSGRSPALARRIGRFLAKIFGPEWQERVEELAALRDAWRESGADAGMVGAWTETWIDRHGELPAEIGTPVSTYRYEAPPLAAQ